MDEKISDNLAQACSEESRSIEANMFKHSQQNMMVIGD
jgi:hypothetical protein